jgi:predicted DNA-binding ribbon-helix-helix protein
MHRYREKRKNRKFEKTIRYASRKAYAEVSASVRVCVIAYVMKARQVRVQDKTCSWPCAPWEIVHK